MKYLYNGTKIIASSRGEAITKIVASEQFRNIKFSEADRIIISAASDDHIAYIARLEHALNMNKSGQFQILLRSCGDKSFLFC